MRAEERSALMVSEADRLINLNRSARISPPDIAEGLGTSRSLVYSYFPDPEHLIEAVLERHAALLAKAGFFDALREKSLTDAIIRSALIYCDHVADHGAAIDLCLREPRVADTLGGDMRSLVVTTLRRLGRLVMRELLFGPAEAIALVRILQVIPEDAARLVRSGDVSREVAHRVCKRLILASIDELRPAVPG